MKEQNHSTGRNPIRRHGMQLQTYRTGKFLEVTGRSILGLVDIYNLLPQDFIDHTDVHEFQRELQGLLKSHAGNGHSDWELLFSPRGPLHMHPLRKLLNGVVSTCGDENITPAVVCKLKRIGIGTLCDE